MSNQIDVFMGCESPFDEAEIVMFSAPYDGTSSFRPGSRFAGAEIRKNSYGIESYSPYCKQDLYDMKVFDAGCLDLPINNSDRMLEIVKTQVREIVINDKKPLMIGGEHLVTLGAVHAMVKKFPDLHILHFDAHADLRDEYLGEKYSHATVMRRVWESVGNKRIFQAGIRSGDAKEFEFATEHTAMGKFDLKKMKNFCSALAGKPVYLSLDLDVLDPACFPGTGTPEPGGVSFRDLHEAILSLRDLNIVGGDVVELAPHYDASGVSTMVACKLIREILMVMGQAHA